MFVDFGHKNAYIVTDIIIGAVAQLGERVNGIHEAEGSIPFSSTKSAACEHLPFKDTMLDHSSPFHLLYDRKNLHIRTSHPEEESKP